MSTPTINSLPPELLDLIFRSLREPTTGLSYGHQNFVYPNAPVLAAALVCHNWTPVAQRVLWHDMRISVRVDHDFTERNVKLAI
ncbi:hypothetical protein RQP46_003653 [Phenoliferia psychrophenolica]